MSPPLFPRVRITRKRYRFRNEERKERTSISQIQKHSRHTGIHVTHLYPPIILSKSCDCGRSTQNSPVFRNFYASFDPSSCTVINFQNFIQRNGVKDESNALPERSCSLLVKDSKTGGYPRNSWAQCYVRLLSIDYGSHTG